MQKTDKEVLAFLKDHYIMQMGTATSKAIPQVNVMLYAVNDDFSFFCATHRDSLKARNLLQNPIASLAIWAHDKMLVQVQANVIEVKGDEVEKAIDMLGEAAAQDESFWPPVLRIEGGSYIVFKLIPKKLSVLDLASKHLREEDSPFTQII